MLVRPATDASRARTGPQADDAGPDEAQGGGSDPGKVDEAFNRIIAVVKRTSGDERDRARKHLLGLFDTLPADDPSLGKARRALASALF